MLAILVLSVALGLALATTTAEAGSTPGQPFEFIAEADECAPGYPEGARIVAGQWIEGLGLPDGGGSNVPTNDTDPFFPNSDTPNKGDRRNGLLVAKTGSTPTCSSAGLVVRSLDPIPVGAGTTLGYDVRRGSHCSGGAPRFNVRTEEGGFYFVGACTQSYATSSPAPQDPTGWTRVRFDLMGAGIPDGHTVSSVSIVFDEGTDTGDGLAVIDNIQVGDLLITSKNKSISAVPE
jgi:hypothetical protein